MTYLVLPNQLFHDFYPEEDKICLVEHPKYFTDYNYHKQKLILHRASINAYKDEIGNDVEHIELDESHEQPFIQNSSIKVIRPEDHEIRRWIQDKASKHDCKVEFKENPMFLNSMEYNRNYFEDNSYFQLSYYKEQRKKHEVLIDDNQKPEGGKWSFDPENREKLPEDVETPDIPNFSNKYVSEAKEWVEKEFSDNPGSIENFIWPTRREEAVEMLEDFLQHRMDKFGKYQDAFENDLEYGFHSLISSSLNTGLLTPDEVVDKTLKHHKDRNYPLNSVEGFLRQILGWREFVRAMYHIKPDMDEENFFNCQNDLPDSFYTGETGLPPVDSAIKNVQNNAYTHHIERLMVLGNVMLLLEIHPKKVSEWFTEMFIDAYEWVMVPNVFGMSQYAWTEMMTKPYISSSNYVNKMSHYQGGKWEEYWDGLYWNFIQEHEEKISNIQRMSFMTSTLNRMNESTVDNHVSNAEEYKNKIGLGE